MAIQIHPYWRGAVEEAREERSRRARQPPPDKGSDDCHIQHGCFVLHPTKRTGYTFVDGRSAVLGLPTVFNPFHPSSAVAGWPCADEQHYEGDGRIATDPLHRRFPAVPRVPGNPTVNWQQRNTIEPWPLENFWRTRHNNVDIMMRSYNIPDLEFTHQQGVQAVGRELMNLLDDVGTQECSYEDFMSSSAPPANPLFEQSNGPLTDQTDSVGHFNLGLQAYDPRFSNEPYNGVGGFSRGNDRGARMQAQGKQYLDTHTTDDLAAVVDQNGFRASSGTATPNWDKAGHFRARSSRPAP
ncbi:hypothetical protein CERZMDRAFT_95271 [Cercospora zeae-maydis SCOH1-5]|uniref:Uncharacterized protein n=1 Tax=Cercospora zeae-maydis SCOH1-5 TaxID=717836 RepID=A0A6A6FNB2_9PEZI|nr:hypothetical protein CERZMDRAFT_95271 [Cercospora zeae-maydis SCOH1-5]